MEIKRADSRKSGEGPAEWLTGTVRIDPLFEAPELSTASLRPARVRGARLHYGYGAAGKRHIRTRHGTSPSDADRVAASPGIHIRSARR